MNHSLGGQLLVVVIVWKIVVFEMSLISVALNNKSLSKSKVKKCICVA